MNPSFPSQGNCASWVEITLQERSSLNHDSNQVQDWKSFVANMNPLLNFKLSPWVSRPRILIPHIINISDHCHYTCRIVNLNGHSSKVYTWAFTTLYEVYNLIVLFRWSFWWVQISLVNSGVLKVSFWWGKISSLGAGQTECNQSHLLNFIFPSI